MTPAVIRTEIRRIEELCKSLERELAIERNTLEAALSADVARYSARDVSEARSAVARTERRLGDARARVEALSKQLPPESAVAAAREAVTQLEDRHQRATTRAAQSWAALLDGLESLEVVARKLMQERREAAAAAAQIQNLAEAHAIVIARPEPPTPSRTEVSLAAHIAIALREIAEGGEPSDTVETYLLSARNQLHAASRATT